MQGYYRVFENFMTIGIITDDGRDHQTPISSNKLLWISHFRLQLIYNVTLLDQITIL